MHVRRALWVSTLLLPSLLTGAQQPNAPQPLPSIIGTVTDVQNEAIGGAEVTLEGPVPAERATAKTNAQGFFTFPNLQPGVSYRVIVAAKGFADWTSSSLVLQPAQQLDLGDIHVNIAVVQTTVTAVSTEQIATREVHAE